MPTLRPHFILGYHGCDQVAGEAALNGGSLVASNNQYDWLGTGVYFWEGDPDRAANWAADEHQRQKRLAKEKGTPIRILQPFVVGAIINLGNCLDLTTQDGIKFIRAGYTHLKDRLEKAGSPIPENAPVDGNDGDRKKRFLDFGVINHTCNLYLDEKKIEIDTVRAMFLEGGAPYPGSGFTEKGHTQICVRTARSIISYFRCRGPT